MTRGVQGRHRMPQPAGSCPDDTWARGLLSHTSGRVGVEWGCRDGGNNNNTISGDTNNQEDPACYMIQKAAVKSLCFHFPISQIRFQILLWDKARYLLSVSLSVK